MPSARGWFIGGSGASWIRPIFGHAAPGFAANFPMAIIGLRRVGLRCVGLRWSGFDTARAVVSLASAVLSRSTL